MITAFSFFHRYLNLLHLQKVIPVSQYSNFKCVYGNMICQNEKCQQQKIEKKGKILFKKEKKPKRQKHMFGGKTCINLL